MKRLKKAQRMDRTRSCAEITETDWTKIRNLGKKSAEEIIAKINELTGERHTVFEG